MPVTRSLHGVDQDRRSDRAVVVGWSARRRHRCGHRHHHRPGRRPARASASRRRSSWSAVSPTSSWPTARSPTGGSASKAPTSAKRRASGSGSPAGPRSGDVMPGSPADRAGLVSGDVITEMGAEHVRSSTDLVIALRSHKPGEVVVVGYWRGGAPPRGRASPSSRRPWPATRSTLRSAPTRARATAADGEPVAATAPTSAAPARAERQLLAPARAERGPRAGAVGADVGLLVGARRLPAIGPQPVVGDHPRVHGEREQGRRRGREPPAPPETRPAAAPAAPAAAPAARRRRASGRCRR